MGLEPSKVVVYHFQENILIFWVLNMIFDAVTQGSGLPGTVVSSGDQVFPASGELPTTQYPSPRY